MAKEEDIKEEVKEKVVDFAESAKLELKGLKEEARVLELCGFVQGRGFMLCCGVGLLKCTWYRRLITMRNLGTT